MGARRRAPSGPILAIDMSRGALIRREARKYYPSNDSAGFNLAPAAVPRVGAALRIRRPHFNDRNADTLLPKI
jgi:hypothetical protein